jgi:cytoskeletal protein RodZ
VIFLEEIGRLLQHTRENAGISLKEVSEDLDIDEAILENIEDGKSGAFSDVFTLKEYVANYAKYLGLDYEKIIDEFNEFVFEATSKIPVKDIEKQIESNMKSDSEEKKVISPYTKKEKKVKNGIYVIIYVVLVLLLILAVIWSVKQITINNQNATAISYGK